MKIQFMVGAVGVLILGSLGLGHADPATITPEALWLDDQGNHINAHGGGILKQGDTYYWYGEYYPKRDATVPPYKPAPLGTGQRFISCYSSQDLANWKFCNLVVKADDPAKLGGGWILERPKVFYNARTKQYVMYTHIDSGHYNFASVAVFTCATPDGEFTYLKNFQPLGQQSRDIGQFIDDDGTAYLIFEDRPNGFHIVKLSDDYLSVDHEVCLIKQHMEGGALVHYDGLYYVLGSQLTGWGANANKYATATKLEGPWSDFKDVAPPEKKTYGSQSTLLLKVQGMMKTTVIFLGDIWKPDTQWDSRYLWMPVEIGGGSMRLPEPAPNWSIDVQTGVSAIPSM